MAEAVHTPGIIICGPVLVEVAWIKDGSGVHGLRKVASLHALTVLRVNRTAAVREINAGLEWVLVCAASLLGTRLKPYPY